MLGNHDQEATSGAARYAHWEVLWWVVANDEKMEKIQFRIACIHDLSCS